jgi:DNA polymerase III sliding clamp (beta) subunit (PCNA family)
MKSEARGNRMEVIREKLLTAMSVAGRWVSPNSPNETFKCLRLKASHDKLSLDAANAEGMAKVEIQHDGLEDIEALVELTPFRSAVRAMDGDVISISLSGSRMTLAAGGAKMNIPLVHLPWRELSLNALERTTTVKAEEFARQVSRLSCVEAARRGEMEFARAYRISCGENNQVSSSSSNMWASVLCDFSASDLDVLVSAPAMQMLASALNGVSGDLTIGMHHQTCAFVADGLTAVLPTVSGKNPWVRGSVQKQIDAGSEWSFDRKQLEIAVRQAGLFTTEWAAGVWIKPSDEGVTVEFDGVSDDGNSNLTAAGTGSVFCPGSASGSPIKVNQRWVASILAAAGDEGFGLRVLGNAMFVLSEGFAAGVGLMGVRK